MQIKFYRGSWLPVLALAARSAWCLSSQPCARTAGVRLTHRPACSPRKRARTPRRAASRSWVWTPQGEAAASTSLASQRMSLRPILFPGESRVAQVSTFISEYLKEYLHFCCIQLIHFLSFCFFFILQMKTYFFNCQSTVCLKVTGSFSNSAKRNKMGNQILTFFHL